MKLDDTLLAILIEVQEKTNSKFNTDLSLEEIKEVVNIQMLATSFAFARKLPITWKGFLKFYWADKSKRNKERKELLSDIESPDYDLTPQQREHFRYLTLVESNKSLKALRGLELSRKILSKDELLSVPTKSIHFLDFKVLCKKKKK